MSSGWSEEAVGALRELIRNPDLSYEQIGQDPRINKPRGAVCGKVDRLGLGRKSDASAIRNRARIKAAQESRVVSRAPVLPQTNDFKRIMASHKEEAAVRTLKSLVDLEEGECRFVYGDPLVRPEVFCGQRVVPGKPYCLACCKRAYEVVEVVRYVPARRERQEATAVRVRVDA